MSRTLGATRQSSQCTDRYPRNVSSHFGWKAWNPDAACGRRVCNPSHLVKIVKGYTDLNVASMMPFAIFIEKGRSTKFLVYSEHCIIIIKMRFFLWDDCHSAWSHHGSTALASAFGLHSTPLSTTQKRTKKPRWARAGIWWVITGLILLGGRTASLKLLVPRGSFFWFCSIKFCSVWPGKGSKEIVLYLVRTLAIHFWRASCELTSASSGVLIVAEFAFWKYYIPFSRGLRVWQVLFTTYLFKNFSSALCFPVYSIFRSVKYVCAGNIFLLCSTWWKRGVSRSCLEPQPVSMCIELFPDQLCSNSRPISALGAASLERIAFTRQDLETTAVRRFCHCKRQAGHQHFYY